MEPKEIYHLVFNQEKEAHSLPFFFIFTIFSPRDFFQQYQRHQAMYDISWWLGQADDISPLSFLELHSIFLSAISESEKYKKLLQ